MLWTIIAILVVLWLVGPDRRHRRFIDSRAACYCGDSVDLQPDQRSPDSELTRARNRSIIE